MKLLPSPSSARHPMRADSTLGQGVDAALVVVVFLLAGLALDSWLGTSPWLAIASFLVAMVGLFYTWKSRYLTRMDELQAQREHDATRHRHAPDVESIIES
jgi:ABC-type nickel/cobalt efflux system permease component RcnA